MNKTYLGDGVYVQARDRDIILTTEDGISVSNTIYLEPSVLHALLQWLKTEGF